MIHAIAAALVAILFSGCLGTPSPEMHDGFEWGLGLDIEPSFPPLGEFREPIAEVVYWDAAMDRIAASNEQNCTRAEGVGDLGQPYMIELELNYLVTFGCRVIPPESSKDGLLSALQTQLDWNRAEFASRSSYPNISTVEIVSQLMGTQLSLEHDMHIYISLDKKGEVTEAGLIQVYGRMLGSAEVIERVLSDIPIGGPCGQPATELADETLTAYENLTTDPPGRASLEASGALTEELEPAKRNVEDLHDAMTGGFWPLYYRIASKMTYHQAYFDLAESGTLATYEEAVYLHALNANRMRAIKYDSHMIIDASGLEAPEFWEETPSWALRIMARHQQEWTFERIPCTGG